MDNYELKIQIINQIINILEQQQKIIEKINENYTQILNSLQAYNFSNISLKDEKSAVTG